MNSLRKFSALLLALCLAGCGVSPLEAAPVPAGSSGMPSEDIPAPDPLADIASFMADDFTAKIAFLDSIRLKYPFFMI